MMRKCETKKEPAGELPRDDGDPGDHRDDTAAVRSATDGKKAGGGAARKAANESPRRGGSCDGPLSSKGGASGVASGGGQDQLSLDDAIPLPAPQRYSSLLFADLEDADANADARAGCDEGGSGEIVDAAANMADPIRTVFVPRRTTRRRARPGAFSIPGRSGNAPLDAEIGGNDEEEGEAAEPGRQAQHQTEVYSVLDASAVSGSGPRRLSGSGDIGERSVRRIERTVRRIASAAPLVEGRVAPRRGSDGGRDGGAEDENEGDKAGWRALLCRRSTLAVIAVAVVVLAVAVPTAVILTGRRGGASGTGPPSAPPSPTPPPSSADGLQRFQELWRAAREVSDEEDLFDRSTPQFAALTWLAQTDEILPSPIEDYSAATQRYVMALLYFSLGGDTWRGTNLAERASFECFALELDCWDAFEGIDMERSGPGVPYLSKDSHECDWEGVGCHSGTGTVGAISIPYNNLTGELQQEIFTLPRLQEFYLASNHIRGQLPMSIQGLGDTINAIHLSINELSGTILDVFDALPNLTHMGLTFNRLTGSVPQTLNGHKHLEIFYANRNALNGTIPLDFSDTPSLWKIDLSNNDLSGPIPPSTDKWANGVVLNLGYNQLTGMIPNTLDRLSHLRLLHLGPNHFSGTIPSSIFNLEELVSLALQENLLTGSLPENLGNARSLQVLWGQDNSLNGTIPGSIGEIQPLRAFAVHRNVLTGTLPDTMGDQTSLQFLDFGKNKLRGTFPNMFDASIALAHLGLAGNDLTGNLNFLCGLDIQSISADCGGVNPEVDCDCCNPCCIDGAEVMGCDYHISPEALWQAYCMKGGLGTVICGGNS